MIVGAGGADLAEQLTAALRTMADPAIAVGARRIDPADVGGLHQIEADAVARVVRSRLEEFATGRTLLRRLIGEDVTIPIASSRRPILPKNVRGSLAHDHRYAVAAITRDPRIRSLGIDIEPTVQLSAEMTAVIVRDDEAGLDAHLAFTLKEATYKAWSSLGGSMLDHHDVRLDVSAASFSAEILPATLVMQGSYEQVGDRWVALVTVSAGGGRSG
jgi:4'-phosphopantetheinyl transferase EntD